MLQCHQFGKSGLLNVSSIVIQNPTESLIYHLFCMDKVVTFVIDKHFYMMHISHYSVDAQYI